MQRTAWSSVVLALVLSTACKKDAAKSDASDGGATTASAASAQGGQGGPPCKEDTNKKTGPNGKITSCILATDFTIDGYTCEAAKLASFQTDGKLKDCYLKTAKTVDGTSCKEGLSLYASGKLRRCKTTAARTAGDGIDIRAGDWVTFYEAGGIKRLELAAGPNKIQGLPCKGYLNYFHENGKLKKCELNEDATIEGKKVAAKGPKGESVYVCFDDKGKRVADCNLLTGMTMD